MDAQLKHTLSQTVSGVIVWSFRIFLIAVFLWLRSEFISKDKYLNDQGKQLEQWTKLTATLTHIDDVIVSLDKHDDDQEKRLRDLEHQKK